jgi:ICE2
LWPGICLESSAIFDIKTFSLALASFYFTLSSMRLSYRKSQLEWIPNLVGFVQTFIVFVILVTVLNKFSNDAPSTHWVHRLILKPWDWALTKSTPAFTLIEGFASLLVIQAIGQICRWVANHRSDSWLVQIVYVTNEINFR